MFAPLMSPWTNRTEQRTKVRKPELSRATASLMACTRLSTLNIPLTSTFYFDNLCLRRPNIWGKQRDQREMSNLFSLWHLWGFNP